MMYGIYKDSRNAAWQCLLDHKISELPVKLEQITNAAKIKVYKNSSVNLLSGCESGAAFIRNGQWYIIYEDDASVGRQRFTIAHELGHIMLGHDLIDGFHGRSFDTDKPINETAADMFAIRLLAPACILYDFNLHTPTEISKICNISFLAAKNRAERMAELYKRNKFFSHELERQVYEQFKNFIEKNKKRN